MDFLKKIIRIDRHDHGLKDLVLFNFLYISLHAGDWQQLLDFKGEYNWYEFTFIQLHYEYCCYDYRYELNITFLGVHLRICMYESNRKEKIDNDPDNPIVRAAEMMKEFKDRKESKP